VARATRCDTRRAHRGYAVLWVSPLPNTAGIPHAWLVRLVHVANSMGDIVLLTGLVVLSPRQTLSGSLRLVRTAMLALAVKPLAEALHARGVAVGDGS
jgi:hypothetical protein